MSRQRMLVSASLLLAGGLSAQELLWERTGRGVAYDDFQQLGGMVAPIGDVNADGWADLVTQVLVKVPNTATETQIWVLSGRDGSLLRVRRAYEPVLQYEMLASAGDWDSDGVADYATVVVDYNIQRQRLPVKEVCSGRDDRVLWSNTTTTGGNAILSDLDLNGDGKPDVVFTDPCCGYSYGRVHAYSNEGQLLYRVDGSVGLAFVYQGQQTLGKVGDLDRDGCDDFVVGALDRRTGLGAAAVISGRTGRVIVVATDVVPGETIGTAVDGCGDLDGDGYPDFVAGGLARPGRVRVFSGRTGQQIRGWIDTQKDSDLGFTVKSGGLDFDRDGVPDIVAGAPGRFNIPDRPTYGRVYVFSGRDGSILHSVWYWKGNYLPGYQLAVLPPQPGSPFPLFIEVETGWHDFIHPGYLGRILAFRGSPAGVEAYGGRCRGTLATFPTIGMQDLGPRGVRIPLHGAAPGSPAVLLLGLSRDRFGSLPLPLPLWPLGFPGCMLLTSVDSLAVTITGSSGLARGYAAVDVPLPLGGPTPLHAQWVSLLGSGGALSDALRWR